MQIPRLTGLPAVPIEPSVETSDQARHKEERPPRHPRDKKGDGRPREEAAAPVAPAAELPEPGQCLDTEKWVKLLPDSPPASSEGPDRFLREARAKSVTEGTRVLKKA